MATPLTLSYVASDSDLNGYPNFVTKGASEWLQSTGSLGPVNGPSGQTDPKWLTYDIWWGNGSADVPQRGSQHFINANGEWVRNYAYSTSAGVSLGTWIRVATYETPVFEMLNSKTGKVTISSGLNLTASAT